MMKTIQLTQGFHAVVDDDDYERLMQFKWYASVHPRPNSMRIYARTGSNKSMHQVILGSKGIDHIDGNGLNNQKENLRLANSAENGANRRKTKGSSGYKGVYACSGKWRSNIRVGGKTIHLGTFNEEVDAAQAYNFAAEEHFGKFALLNAPL